MARLTHNEYIAKAMLLGLVYVPASHTFKTEDGGIDAAGVSRYDPDTLQPINVLRKVGFISDRMAKVDRGEIGPTDRKRRNLEASSAAPKEDQ